MASPISSRKLDLLYLVFFVIHVPIMFAVDFGAYYPTFIRPSFTKSIQAFYISNYRDRFFIAPPLWFKGFVFLELAYHVPLSIWAVPALLRDDPTVPLQLLVFAMLTAITTFTCTLEMLSWEGYTSQEQSRLCWLYLPYLGLAIVMGGDMFLRLRVVLIAKAKLE